MMPVRICEIVNGIIWRNGHFTTQDIENAEEVERAYPRPPARPMINAQPHRWKFCPLCMAHQPIAEFLMPTVEVRTVVLMHREALEEFAYPCANISEICQTCACAAD